MDTSLLLSQLAYGRALLEDNAASFIKRVDSVRYEKGRKLEHYYEKLTADKQGNAVVVFRIPSERNKSQKDPSKHKFYHCFVDIIPKDTTLFNLAKSTARLGERIQVLKDADIKFFCTCPDFNWSGMKYNAKHVNDSFSVDHHADDDFDDHGEDINPRVRDPEHKTTMCKHLVATCKGILTNAANIMRDARQFNLPPKEEEKPQMSPENTPVGTDAVDEKAEREEQQAEKEAVNFFSDVPAFKTDESLAAMDKLSEELEPDADNVPDIGLGEDGIEEPETSEEETENPTEGLLGQVPDEDYNPYSSFVDYDEESKLDMFNQPVDDDELNEEDEGESPTDENGKMKLPT